eukprot:Gb_31389 [translate_table: standard]
MTKGEAQEDAKKEFAEALVLMEGTFDQISFGKLYSGGHEFGYPDSVFAPFICLYHAFEALGDFKLPLEKCPNSVPGLNWIEKPNFSWSSPMMPLLEHVLQDF